MFRSAQHDNPCEKYRPTNAPTGPNARLVIKHTPAEPPERKGAAMILHPSSLRRFLGVAAGLTVLGLAVWTATAAQAQAAQGWPQWRGPLHTGVAPAADPPVTWSETSNVR